MAQTACEAPLDLMNFAVRQAARSMGAIAIDGYAEVRADLSAMSRGVRHKGDVISVNTDPRETLSSAPMSALQIITVAITVGLTALDGFDVLSISFASPGIATEWGIDRAQLGIVLSMELMGMALGSVLLGGVADKIGRRPTMLGCLVLMTLGMFMVTTVKQIPELQLWRFTTGLGIGGLLAASNAVAAEFSNLRRRNLCVSIMAIGYPVGAVVGGTDRQAAPGRARVALGVLFRRGDHRVVHSAGVLLLVPESVHWLTNKQPANALERINRALVRMGHAAIAALPVLTAEARKRSVADIFAPALIMTTLLLSLAYFFHVVTFYFMLKWVPKIVVDMHFAPAAAAGVLVWANVGGRWAGRLSDC